MAAVVVVGRQDNNILPLLLALGISLLMLFGTFAEFTNKRDLLLCASKQQCHVWVLVALSSSSFCKVKVSFWK